MLEFDIEFFRYVFNFEVFFGVFDIFIFFLFINDMGESLINKIIEVLIIVVSECFKIQLIIEFLLDKEWLEIYNFVNINLC